MSEVADYSRGEPAPIPNESASMHDLVIEDLRTIRSDGYACHARNRLITLVAERKEFGLKKYNTPLQANNGRNPVNDMKDELLDALVYARQYMCEDRPGHRPMIVYYQDIMKILLEVLALEERGEL